MELLHKGFTFAVLFALCLIPGAIFVGLVLGDAMAWRERTRVTSAVLFAAALALGVTLS